MICTCAIDGQVLELPFLAGQAPQDNKIRIYCRSWPWGVVAGLELAHNIVGCCMHHHKQAKSTWFKKYLGQIYKPVWVVSL